MLLCEGDDDCHVVFALLEYHKVPEDFQVESCGSDDLAIKKAAALVLAENTEVVGVVLDADSPSGAIKWQRLRERLKRVGIQIPDGPEPKGTIVEAAPGRPRMGIWLMPDNTTDGMLEDFCAALTRPDAFAYAGECVKSAKSLGRTSFKPSHSAKAHIHTYLAWQNEPGRPLGQSITARTLDPSHELAQSFAEWARRLFHL